MIPWAKKTRNFCNAGKNHVEAFYYFKMRKLTEMKSAMNGPGANYPVQVMMGSNHFQMRNDSKTKDATELIFERGIGGKYFKSN